MLKRGILKLTNGLNRRLFGRQAFTGSKKYWEQRYLSGGNSGVGSYGELAKFKAEVINKIVADEGIQTVVEFGCGDGAQLALANYPNYKGYDVAESAVKLCRKIYEKDATREFALLGDYEGEAFDLAMSLDVIYHLVEDEVWSIRVQCG